jgi:hypothetical protein
MGVKRRVIEAGLRMTGFINNAYLCATAVGSQKTVQRTQNYSPNKAGNVHVTYTNEVRSDLCSLQTSQTDILLL